MKKCTKCEQEYGDDKKYCLRCGISLDQENKEDILICDKCATANQMDFKFCKTCGKQLDRVEEKASLKHEQIDLDRKQTEQPAPELKEDSFADLFNNAVKVANQGDFNQSVNLLKQCLKMNVLAYEKRMMIHFNLGYALTRGLIGNISEAKKTLSKDEINEAASNYEVAAYIYKTLIEKSPLKDEFKSFRDTAKSAITQLVFNIGGEIKWAKTPWQVDFSRFAGYPTEYYEITEPITERKKQADTATGHENEVTGQNLPAQHATVIEPVRMNEEGTECPLPKIAETRHNGGELFEQYLRLAASGQGSEETKMELLNKALALGLPLKDEVFSHISIGIQLASLDDLNKAVEKYDYALSLARNYEEIFSSDSVRLLCRSVCAAYILKARETKKLSGIEEGLSYLHAKEMLLKQLCSPVIYLELAVLHKEKDPDDFDVILSYYNKTIDCDILDDMDESSVQKAKDALAILDKLLSAMNLKVTAKTLAPETPAQKKHFSPSVAVAQPEIKGSERSYMKFVIIGVIVLVLVVAAFFLKSYLSKTSDQEGKDILQKPQPAQLQKPVERPNPTGQQPIVEQPIQQPVPTAVDSPQRTTELKHKQPAPVARPKPQSVPPDTIKDQEPTKVEKKSFAPHSRDDL